jgi:hypothetical protein
MSVLKKLLVGLSLAAAFGLVAASVLMGMIIYG